MTFKKIQYFILEPASHCIYTSQELIRIHQTIT